MFNNYNNIFLSIFAIIFVLVTHEIAHGYVALLNGDDTAKNMGRLSINPLKHLDLLGLISMIIFRFGWAKPVPINPNKFKNFKIGMFTVSIAGIVINLLTAFIALILSINVEINLLKDFLSLITRYGIIFAVFNLIPIPPLDGSKVLLSFLPIKVFNFVNEYESYFFMALMIILYTRLVDNYIAVAFLNVLRFMFEIIRFMGLL